MSLQRWNPFEELSRLEEEFGRVFGTARGEEHLAPLERTYSPLTDVHETENEFVVKMNVPGVKKEDLDIQATPEYLEVKIEKTEASEKTENAKVLHRERYAQKFYRKIAFPVPTDVKKAITTLNDGILTIHLPKAEQVKATKLLLQ